MFYILKAWNTPENFVLALKKVTFYKEIGEKNIYPIKLDVFSCSKLSTAPPIHSP